MQLEQQVTSQSISEQLKNLGVKQASLFYWVKDFDVNNAYTGNEPIIEDERWLDFHEMEKAKICSAFSVAELLNILPAALERTATWLTLRKQWNGGYYVEYVPDDGEPGATHHQPPTTSDNPADTLGLMLIYLLKNQLITL